ncbi:hypothetical protein [Burkholderia sp. MSMB617WGS]|uniref:hypothetical protein n=1 Tax=Burkholderia sp. MSMB617WGS TaxID=1637831 RepID=UPI0016478EB2|nr:hypothetical protein [Burkholderia sp. MSMB617WGS]
MSDIQSQRDFAPLADSQIRDLAVALRDVFGSNLSREQFNDTLLMFLEGVPGYESGGERWPHSFGQVSEIFKWNVRGNHAADLIAGSVAKYASSGV